MLVLRVLSYKLRKTASTAVHRLLRLFREVRFVRKVAWTIMGSVVYAGSQWGIIALLAKLGNAQMVGQFSIALAVTAPIMLMANLQLRAVQSTETSVKFGFGDYLVLRLTTSSLAIVVIGGMALSGAYSFETKTVIFLIGLAKGVESLSDVVYGKLQQRENMERIASSMIVRSLVSLVGFWVTLQFSSSVTYAVASLPVVWALTFLVYDVPHLRRQLGSVGIDGPPRPAFRGRIRRLVKLLCLSVPLGFAAALASLNANIPRYLLQRHMGEESVGVYSALAYFALAGGTVVGAIGQVASPRLAKAYADGSVSLFLGLLKKLLLFTILLGTGGVAIAVFAGELILSAFYTADYGQQARAFTWIMAGTGLGYVSSVLGVALTSMRAFRVQLPMFAVVCLMSLLLGGWLIPAKGLIGAGMATLGASCAQAILSGILVVRAAFGAKRSLLRVEPHY